MIPNRFQDVQGSIGYCLDRKAGLLKADLDVRLGSKVVDFRRVNQPKNSPDGEWIAYIAIVEL